MLFKSVFLSLLSIGFVVASNVPQSEPQPIDALAVRDEIIAALTNRNFEAVDEIVSKHPEVKEKFNRNVFEAILNCFSHGKGFNWDLENNEKCMAVFELFSASYLNVEGSTTTPVIMTVKKGDSEILTRLIKMKVSVDGTDEMKRTALMYACAKEDVYATTQILRYHKDSLDLADDFGMTALHYACECKILKVVEMILTTGTNVFGASDYTPSSTSRLEAVEALLKGGASIIRNGRPYDVSMFDWTLIKTFKEHGAKININYNHSDNRLIQSTLFTSLFAAKLLGISNYFVKFFGKILHFLTQNALFWTVNDFFYFVTRQFLPEMDLNCNLTFMDGEMIYDISVNVVFLLFIMAAITKAFEKRIRSFNEPNIQMVYRS